MGGPRVSPGSPGTPRVVLVLVAAVLAISAAGPLVVRAGVGPELAALWRTGLSALLLAVVYAVGGLFRGRTGRAASGSPVSGGLGGAWISDRPALGWAAASGVLLALHFWAWFGSLGLCSIATSTLLVTLSPVWASLAAPWVWGEEPLRAGQWGGVLLSLAAAAVLVLAGSVGRSAGVATTPFGLLLAVAGGWLAAAYFLASRRARRSLDLLPYALVVNGVAALVLGVVCVLQGVGSPWPGSAFGWLVLLAVLPQLVGHNGIAWALRYRGTAWVSQVVLLEPVGATLLGAVWLGMWPGPLEIVCGVLIVMGLMRVMR